ncbi:MAG TPA: glycosyltransferase [Solirubrobacteraceae bacterium]|nr:glycosyltransferase [Solirubrobacteraceae bacterium]
MPARGAPGDAQGAPAPALDVVIVSLGSTAGLRRADAELRDALERAGARAAIAPAQPPAPRRTLMLTDLAWALAARAAATRALAHTGRGARQPAIVYSSTTAALLWPRPGAIRFDATAAGNRPGRHGLWQRPLERHRLAQAPLLLPWSVGGLREAPAAARRGDRALVLPVPVELSAPPRELGQHIPATPPAGTSSTLGTDSQRDIAAITYAANPAKKGLDRVLAAWRGVRDELPVEGPRELVVAGATDTELRAARADLRALPGVRSVGPLSQTAYRALLRRARVFVCAPRREDYGIAQLEALADGCLLVTTPAPGPYVALGIARALDARLVSEDLARALRAALLHPVPDYAAHALQAIAPFRRAASDRIVAEELLARLLVAAAH